MSLRRTVIVYMAALLLGAVVLTSCAPKLQPEPLWEKDARALLDQADGFYAKKQYDHALKAANDFVVLFPKSRYQDRARFLLGEVHFARRDYPQALSNYKDVLEKYPASPFITDAKYKLGLCYFEIKEYDLAIANLQDRTRVTDPVRLVRTAEVLAAAYTAKEAYLPAVKEFAYLAMSAPNVKQQAGYRDRVREMVAKNLTESDLTTLSEGTTYPADLALLRLASLMIEQKKYRDAIRVAKDFLAKFPTHPEKTRAEMIETDATAQLTSPRYSLGALIPQTGPAAFYGDRVLRGIQLAVHSYNLKNADNRVEILVRDTEGSPEKAAAALSELAPKGMIAAIGPLLTREVEALAPIVQQLKVPVITPAASGAGLGELSPWIFRNALTNASQARAAAQYAVGQKLKKIVIMYPDDPYGRDLSRLFARYLGRAAEVLATVPYPTETNDFGPYIKRVMETDLRSRRIVIPEDDAERKKLFQDYTPSFDSLYLPGTADRVGLLIPQLAFYNITGMKLIGSSSWHTPDLLERAGRHAEGAVFTDGFMPESTVPAVKEFVESYRSAYQEEPDVLSAQAFDAAMMVLTLIKEHKDTPTAVRDGLAALSSYPGVSGTTTFNGTGEAQKQIFLITIDSNGFAPASD
jgi:branched-chain amino acid transport system substrate-binding protein